MILLSNHAHRRRRRSSIALCALVLYSLSPSPGTAEERAAGSVHALLINGGHRPTSNYLSHLNHIEEMLDVLEQRGVTRGQIHIFSADGENSSADLAVRDTLPSNFWLIEGTQVGKRLRPRTELTNTEWAKV